MAPAARDGTLGLADDGNHAVLRRAVTVKLQLQFTGHSTVEQIVRFQGHGSHRRSENRVLAAELVKGKHGWRIARAMLA